MTDRLTQLQDAVNMQAEHFCNAIGVLQQFAPTSLFVEVERSQETQQQPPPAEDYPQLFASLIARTAKDIDTLIDSLPSEESTPELQAASLRRFEADNEEAAKKLQESVKRCEDLLEHIQNSLREIAKTSLFTDVQKENSLS